MGARQVLPAGTARAAGVASSPPRRRSRGLDGAARRAAIGQQRPGAGPGRRYLVGRLKRAQDIAERTGALASAQPSLAPPGKLGLGNSGLPWRPRSHKPLDLTCLCAPPTSTPCPHAPAPATGKGLCVFLSPASASLHACPGECGLTRAGVLPVGSRLFPCPAAPEVPSCQAAAARTHAPSESRSMPIEFVCAPAHPRAKNTETCLEQLSNRNISLQHLFVLITSNAPAVARDTEFGDMGEGASLGVSP